MPTSSKNIPIYHILHVERLPGILASGGLLSDKALQDQAGPNGDVGIGYAHIKKRRLTELTVPCCSDRYVGEFVPFYFCKRSPMLHAVNHGRTRYPIGCQSKILYLVSSVKDGISLGRDWAFSDGNAGSRHPNFYNSVEDLDQVDWDAVEAIYWKGRTHSKSAEFLVADFFPWDKVIAIGCYDTALKIEVGAILADESHRPPIEVKPNGRNDRAWYY